MKFLPFAAVLLCLAAPASHAEEAPLFRMTSDIGLEPNGKSPNLVFQEVVRNENSSTIEAEHGTGRVATKTMFVMRGACALMKERKKQAFTIVHLSKQPIRFNVQFLDESPVAAETGDAHAQKRVSSAQCELVESILKR
ncbi:MAG: hypothetical protein V4857_15925 [Pseudomonadota bacterium]